MFFVILVSWSPLGYEKRLKSAFSYPKGVQNLCGKPNEGVYVILVIMASPGWCIIARECVLDVMCHVASTISLLTAPIMDLCTAVLFLCIGVVQKQT